ncbi:hypothetical protein [Treponema pedis]|uniref:Uncharacterized protein n=2 Tax=Treponema pedis TaxID=409322 RepID=A0A7S7AWB6_9SPIR|nr:hypothetical protein [Treponema pedis]QOW60712.1 hypothetical protein IFE08_13110 [Treponema pedis]
MNIRIGESVVMKLSHIYSGKVLIYPQCNAGVKLGGKCYIDLQILSSIFRLLPTSVDVLKTELAELYSVDTVVISKVLEILCNAGALVEQKI